MVRNRIAGLRLSLIQNAKPQPISKTNYGYRKANRERNCLAYQTTNFAV